MKLQDNNKVTTARWIRVLHDISMHQSVAEELVESTSPHWRRWGETDSRWSSSTAQHSSTQHGYLLISRVCTVTSPVENLRHSAGHWFRSRCLQQEDGRYFGVVLEREVLAPTQCNLGWFKKHRWGNVPASRGSLSGVSFSILHLYDPTGFRKVGRSTWWLSVVWMKRGGEWCCTPRCPCFSVWYPNNGILSG